MSKYLFIMLITFTSGGFSLAMGPIFKCDAKSINPQVLRYEVELSFEPVNFKLISYFKEEDGTWSMDSEVLADSAAVLKPIKMNWNSCKTELKQDKSNLNYHWTKETLASGYLSLDLTTHQGEFYSSYQIGGTVYRRVQFENCEEIPLQ